MSQLKQWFVLLAFLGMAGAASAQFGIGTGLTYGAEIEQIGLLARASYQITDQFRAAGTFNFYLGDDTEFVNIWDLNLDAHYLFWQNETVGAYALAGLILATVSTDIPNVVNDSTTDVGLNLGAGAQLKLRGTIIPFLEIKYDFGGFGQLAGTLGIQYLFTR